MPLSIPDDLSATYTRWGITIGRLGMTELEELRRRRNDPAIGQFMIFRDEITPEQQLAWFQRVNNKSNLYGTLYWQGQLIGITNLRDIDEDACTGEGGMIIWAQEHQNSLVPFRAALAGTDLAFWAYCFERITARVIATNRRAIRFNKALGYTFSEPDEHGVCHGSVTYPDYFAATWPLREEMDRQDGTFNGGGPTVAVYVEGWERINLP